jgi:hypothetical protein
MSEVERLREFAVRANQMVKDYEDGKRYNIAFSCGCMVKLEEDRIVGVSAGRGCNIEDGDNLRNHMLKNSGSELGERAAKVLAPHINSTVIDFCPNEDERRALEQFVKFFKGD